MKEISRAELYDLVWSKPMRDLASMFGISDVALRKHCVKAEIPVPERGHWAKLAAGKPTIRPRLPDRLPGLSDVVRVGSTYFDRCSVPSRDEILGPVPDAPTFEEDIESVERKVRIALGKIRSVKTLDHPHIAIRKLLKADDERRQKQLQSRYPMPWDGPIFETPFEQRRLRILSSILMAVAKAGARPAIRGREARDITLHVFDQVVGLELDALDSFTRSRQYEPFRPREPRARMRLVIPRSPGTEKERWHWEDADARKIENDIEEIAVRLILAAEIQYREGRVSSHKWRLTRRAQIIEEDRLAREKAEREERERQETLEQERVDKLLQEAESLHKAETIRAYVERVRTIAAEGAHNPTVLDGWARWALDVANTLDPVRTGRFLTSAEAVSSKGTAA